MRRRRCNLGAWTGGGRWPSIRVALLASLLVTSFASADFGADAIASTGNSQQPTPPLAPAPKPSETSSLAQDVTSAITTGATLGLLLVAVLQWLTYRRQAALMAGQEKLMEAALGNSQLTDRAWVSVATIRVAPTSRSDGRMVVIGLRNSGRTPARIVEANITIRGSTATTTQGDTTLGELVDVPTEPDYDRGDFVPPAVIVAGETAVWRHVVTTVTDENFAFLTVRPGDRHNLWIYGFVKYTDIYNPDPKQAHTYKFGRVYDATLSKKLQRFAFAHLAKPNYNGAD